MLVFLGPEKPYRDPSLLVSLRFCLLEEPSKRFLPKAGQVCRVNAILLRANGTNRLGGEGGLIQIRRQETRWENGAQIPEVNYIPWNSIKLRRPRWASGGL